MKKITFLMMALLAGMFMNAQTYTNMSIVGDGAGGWPPDPLPAGYTDPHQMTSTDNVHWTFENLVTYNGSVKFRTDTSWTNNWGAPAGGAFPNGTAVFNSTTNITTPVGVYNVTFNSSTLEYSFSPSSLYPTISLYGAGVGGTDIDLGTTDGVHYVGNGIAVNGDVRFRQHHEDSASWAPPTFPSGTAVPGAGTLNVANNVYNVNFNLTTLEYSFNFRSIAIVGAGTPQGWPVDPQVDTQVLTTTDGNLYVLNSIALTAAAVKFREDNSWNVQWGAGTTPGFPTGTGTQSGSDILVTTAGTYSVTLNRSTGAYSFDAPIVAGVSTLAKDAFKVYPNPTTGVWNFAAATGSIDTIMITDLTGKTVLTATPKNSVAGIDASGLASGVYFAKVSVAGSVKTMKLIKN